MYIILHNNIKFKTSKVGIIIPAVIVKMIEHNDVRFMFI